MKERILLFRPWSYVATLAPFLLGAALCAGDADLSWWRWSVGMFVGLLFQTTVNLLNTWGDERSGVDAVPGAIRTTPQLHDGVVSAETVMTIAVVCVAVGAVLGVGLCFRDVGGRCVFNWPLLTVGIVGALGALNYSTGVKFKYQGLGVPFVSVLMGVLETVAAQLLISPGGGISTASMVSTLPIALLIGAVMHGNDMRDLRTDRAAGIRTLATVLGSRLALSYYVFAHISAYVIAFVMIRDCSSLLLLAPFLLTVWTIRRAVLTYRTAVSAHEQEHPPWRGLERQTGAVLLLFALTYTAALVWR